MGKAPQDPATPLDIMDTAIVYREQGGVDFTVARADVRDIRTDQRFPMHYVSVKRGRTGAVCVAERNGRLLLARHWRLAINAWEWEFPRGMGEAGEDPARTAIRELKEETGLSTSPAQATCLQHMHADAGVLQDDIAVVRIALTGYDDPTVTETDWELTEQTWCTPEQIDGMIERGEIADGITLAAYTIWRHRR